MHKTIDHLGSTQVLVDGQSYLVTYCFTAGVDSKDSLLPSDPPELEVTEIFWLSPNGRPLPVTSFLAKAVPELWDSINDAVWNHLNSTNGVYTNFEPERRDE